MNNRSDRVETWTESEREMLSLRLAREQYGWYLTVLYLTVCELWTGLHLTSLLLPLVCFPVIYYFHSVLNTGKLTRCRLAVLIMYFELVQLLHYQWARKYQSLAFSYMMASTVLLVSHELTPILPWPVNLFLIAKHIGFWYWLCIDFASQSIFDQHILIEVGWIVYHFYTYLTIKKRVLQSEFSHMQASKQKEAHIEALYDASINGLLVITEDKKVVTYNSVLLEFLDLQCIQKVEEEVYAAISQLEYVPEYSTSSLHTAEPLMTDILLYLLSEKQDLQTIGVVLINGKYLEWGAKQLSWDGKRACIISVRDITRWVELESIAKRESDSKSALIRSVSHELRTPTNAIINLVRDVKEKTVLSEDSLQDVNLLSSAAQFLLSVINDLLDYSSVTTGKFGLTKQFFPLEKTVKECMQLIELQCKHKGLELVLRYDPLLPAQAYNDKNRLKQVVLNLLSNALKFTMKGKIEVVVVSVSETHAGIKVIDTGIGISEESIGKIFKLFGKLEGNEKLNPQGCGLGLSISTLLVKSMGGSGIHVKSKRQIGSVFAFEFSLSPTENSVQSTELLTESSEIFENAIPAVIPRAITSKSEPVFPSILIADDVDYNRIVLRRILEYAGYSCDEANTGLQVLQLVASRAHIGKPYLVILMDVEMPEMDGITATRELAAMTERGEIEAFPMVIGCSAYSAIEDRDMCLRAGMRHYLEKPIIREVLIELIAGVVSRTMRRVRLQSF